MLKSSSDKKTLLTASVFFILTIGAILYISCYSDVPIPPEAKDIYEKQTDVGHLFFNNITLAFNNIILAIPTFGLYPLAILLLNAATLGVLIKYLFESQQQVLILKLVPHGVIELFGLAFSCALILVLLFNVVKAVPRLFRQEETLKELCVPQLKYLLSGVMVVVIVFLVAACVETAVSYIKFA